MKKENLSHIIFFSAIIMMFTVSGILLFILPQRAYSENENRYLTTFQPLSLTGFLDTSLQKNLTDSANDQFPIRDKWMKFATFLQRAAGFQDVGGVYIGQDNCYFERILDSDISKSRYLNNLKYMVQFAESYHTKVTFMPVPSKGTILNQQLPNNAVLYDSDKLYNQAVSALKSVEFLDIRSDLEKAVPKYQLYFRTDHHWTTEASYLAYTAWQHAHSAEIASLKQFSLKCVSRDFYGTLYSKAPDFGIQPDQLYIPSNLTKAEVRIDSKNVESIYDRSKLNTKDKYGVYFGGNFARIDLLMNRQSDGKPIKKLLIIKDSFANSLVPFLMPEFDEIIMLDLRYFNDSICELMQDIQPDETLILYEMSNFAQDMNFFKILK